ncbi:MAG: hypothetical protein IKP40_09710 [Clostridia bacterium]|nr:hypothetical protein [Clostridia bacterium]
MGPDGSAFGAEADLFGQSSEKLSIAPLCFSLSEDRRTAFLFRPETRGGTGSYTYRYECFGLTGKRVRYFDSEEDAAAMTPGRPGWFRMQVTVDDGATRLSEQTGWIFLK